MKRKEGNVTVEKLISFIEKNGCVSVVIIAKEFNLKLQTVYRLIEKIERIMKRKGRKVVIKKAYCKKCGFVLDKLGATKCPKCGSMWIERERICLK